MDEEERKKNKKKNYIYRLMPCPLHDVDGIESWLDDLSRKGLRLVKNSCRGGFAAFQQIEPHEARYRLTGGSASLAQLEADADGEYEWFAAGEMGDYGVYRSIQTVPRTHNGDVLVHAIAEERLRKRLLFDAVMLAVCLVVYPLLALRGAVVLSIVSAGTWLCAMGLAAVLWLFGDSLWLWLHARAVHKGIRAGNEVRQATWRVKAACYYIKNALQLILVLAFLALAFHGWVQSVTGGDRASLAGYTGTPPFATMSQLAGGEADVYEVTMPRYSQVREWNDWLSPRNLDWRESARITLNSGEVLDGGLYVDYHYAASAGIAQRLAEEYVGRDRVRRGFQELEAPALDADFAVFYYTDAYFPTLVLRKGNVTVRALFYQSSAYRLELEDWVRIMAESIS